MIYNNKHELLEMLKENSLWLDKKLGQNFLVDTGIIGRILQAAEISPTDRIVEIGPGMGILTAELAKKAQHVTAVEFDGGILDTLKNNLRGINNVEIINRDALQFPLPAAAYKLVANIPYYITSPLLNHFLNAPEPAPGQPEQLRPSLIVLMVQKEVAEKICAQPGDHGVLSLEVQIFGQPQIEARVSKTSFFPEPKVDSAILKIRPYPKPLVEDTKTFFRLIKAAFSQRRKTLHNSLRSGLMLKSEQVDELLTAANIPPSKRPQALGIPDWQRLVEAFKKRT